MSINKILCWLGIHNYSNWVDKQKGSCISTTGATTGSYIEQEKRCKDCGIVKLRNESC